MNDEAKARAIRLVVALNELFDKASLYGQDRTAFNRKSLVAAAMEFAFAACADATTPEEVKP